MRVTFWGVRGTFPATGAAFARYGGDTMCIEVECAGARVILDAGSGLRALGASLMRRARAIARAHRAEPSASRPHYGPAPFRAVLAQGCAVSPPRGGGKCGWRRWRRIVLGCAAALISAGPRRAASGDRAAPSTALARSQKARRACASRRWRSRTRAPARPFRRGRRAQAGLRHRSRAWRCGGGCAVGGRPSQALIC